MCGRGRYESRPKAVIKCVRSPLAGSRARLLAARPGACLLDAVMLLQAAQHAIESATTEARCAVPNGVGVVKVRETLRRSERDKDKANELCTK